VIFPKVSVLSHTPLAGGLLNPLRFLLAAATLTVAACSRPQPPTTFLCQGGETIVATLGPRYAELHLPPDRVVRLYIAPAASGVTYSDGRYTLLTNGPAAVLERGGEVILRDCRVAGTAPGPDSALTPARARSVVDSVDSLTAGVAPLVRTLQPEARGLDPRIISLWADSARPVKLSVTEPDDTGRMSGRVDYYFSDGRLEVVRGPVSQYVFRDTTLILWTTDSLQHVADMPLRDMVARQNFVLGEVRQYLAMFSIEQ